MPLDKHIDSGLISVQQVDPAELSPGEFVTILRQAVEGTDKSGRQAKVVSIDSLNGYLHSMPEEQFLNAQLHELFTYLNHRGVITLVTVTQSGMIGAAMQTPVDMTYLADNVILYGLGKGSTFTITLPTSGVRRERVAEPRRRETFAPSITSVSAPSIALSLAGLKVLVVDDEPDARGLVRRVLEDCEANVVTAGSVSEAIDQFRNSPPDVLVSDIGMPIEDGYALIRRVRAMKSDEGANVPAVALTAYARSEDRMRSVLAGFQMHLAKPVEPAELITMIASLAGRM
jgi:CheY-like chemotaxis protein